MMAADLILNNLNKSLSEDFGLPTDIKFVFTTKEEEDGSTSIEEIRAHKSILALVSDVFKKCFYGGLEDNGSIDIEDTTKEAFEAMISFIYNKGIDLRSYDFDMLCSIFYLADKYNITALEEETLKAIKGKNIPSGDVIEIGVLAMTHSIHGNVAEALFEAAARRLSRMFLGDIYKAAEYLAQVDTEDTLGDTRYKSVVKIMARLRRIDSTVENTKLAEFEKLNLELKNQLDELKNLKQLFSPHTQGAGGIKRKRKSSKGECPLCRIEVDITMLEKHASVCEGGE